MRHIIIPFYIEVNRMNLSIFLKKNLNALFVIILLFEIILSLYVLVENIYPFVYVNYVSYKLIFNIVFALFVLFGLSLFILDKKFEKNKEKWMILLYEGLLLDINYKIGFENTMIFIVFMILILVISIIFLYKLMKVKWNNYK